jgi:hypothetical protein
MNLQLTPWKPKGFYRLIHPRYLHRMIDAVITIAEIHDMDIARISVDQCRQHLIDEFELKDLDMEVLKKCLEAVSEERSAEDGMFSFNEEKLCRLLGERLLVAERGKQWQLDEFLDVWQKQTPHPFEAKLEFLRVTVYIAGVNIFSSIIALMALFVLGIVHQNTKVEVIRRVLKQLVNLILSAI